MKGQTFIRQRLPGPSELAFPGSGSNHMTPLFSSRPVDGDTTRDPKDDSRVWVTAIMLPSPSTTEKWVVEAGAAGSSFSPSPSPSPSLAGRPTEAPLRAAARSEERRAGPAGGYG